MVAGVCIDDPYKELIKGKLDMGGTVLAYLHRRPATCLKK